MSMTVVAAPAGPESPPKNNVLVAGACFDDPPDLCKTFKSCVSVHEVPSQDSD